MSRSNEFMRELARIKLAGVIEALEQAIEASKPASSELEQLATIGQHYSSLRPMIQSILNEINQTNEETKS
jgi:DNA-binding IscR family transcriptional regulator